MFSGFFCKEIFQRIGGFSVALLQGVSIRKLSQTETEYLHGATLSVPTDGYMQLVTERNIIEQAETVENMISELSATTE